MDALAKPKVVIDPIAHKHILADMQNICRVANVSDFYVRHSMRTFCTEAECEYVRCFKQNRRDNYGGLIVEGADAMVRCMAITGTLVRGYNDARLMTLNNMLDNPGYAQEPTALVIPNFYVGATEFKDSGLPHWKLQNVFDVLLARMAASKPTILGVTNEDGAKKAYGAMYVSTTLTYLR